MPGVGRRLEEAPISQQQGNSIYVFTSEKGYHILQAGMSWPFPPSLAEWSPEGPLFPSSWQSSRPAGSSLDRSGRSRLRRVSNSFCFSFPLTQAYSSYLGKHIWSLLRRLAPLVSEWVKKAKAKSPPPPQLGVTVHSSKKEHQKTQWYLIFSSKRGSIIWIQKFSLFCASCPHDGTSLWNTMSQALVCTQKSPTHFCFPLKKAYRSKSEWQW